MDNKTWLWRKRSSEKKTIATNKFSIPVKGGDIEELCMGNEVGLVRPVRNLSEKLASVLLECDAKDDLAKKQEISAQEDAEGQPKAVAVAFCLKRELDVDPKHGVAANERSTDSDAALKQCLQQLKFLQEEQERRTQEAVMEVSREFEEAQKILEEKLMETSKKLATLSIENTNLSKALMVNEKLVKELHKRSFQTVAEFDVLMERLDSTENENALLRYEFHMIEKELEIRNKELEYTRQSADAAHRQNLESLKKITKLEAECQRLKILMRKTLLGPGDLRRKLNLTRDLILTDTTMEKSAEIPVNNINFLVEQLCGMEEENRNLKEIMTKKNAEPEYSRIMFSRTSSRLSQVDAQLIELSRGQHSVELAKCCPVSIEQPPIAVCDAGSDDLVSSSGSRSNALISELEIFRDEKLNSRMKHNAVKVSNMRLMDEFIEMEKSAIVSVLGNPNSSEKKKKILSKDVPMGETFDWLQDVLNAIYNQQRISGRSLVELLEDVKNALGLIYHPHVYKDNGNTISMHPAESEISGYIAWKSPSTPSTVDSFTFDTFAKDKSKQCSQSNLSKSIFKIIELIEGITLKSLVSSDSANEGSRRDQNLLSSATPRDYFVHVFQWKSSELTKVLRQFVHSCEGLLNGKASLGSFVEEVSFTIEWILCNYVTPKEDSSSRNKIKRHFGWNGSQTESEVGVSKDCSLVEADDMQMSKQNQSRRLHSVASTFHQMELIQLNLQEENKRLKDERQSEKKDMEAKLHASADKGDALTMKLQESEKRIERLQLELETLKESKAIIEDQYENQKLVNEDLDTQLTDAKGRFNEALQKLSCLEVELEDKSNICEELEAICLELQLQLECVAKETQSHDINEDRKQPRNGWEMRTASVKLAECQELGKQLKVLASPKEAALFDKVFAATSATSIVTNTKNLNKHFSLCDQMLAEDNAKAIILRSPTQDAQQQSVKNSDNGNAFRSTSIMLHSPEADLGSIHKAGNTTGTLVIVPGKRNRVVGFLRRLLMRKRKGAKKSKALVKV